MPGEIKNSANQAEQLAGEALELSCQILRIRLRFLDLALRELRPCPRPGMTLLTDGAHLYYGAGYILRRCKDGRDNVARELLHLLLHCVLRHMFVGMVNRELWDLACDLAAEQALLELSLFPAPEDAARRTELEKLRTNSRYMTAEHLYHSLRTHPPAPEQLEELSRLFRTDDHQLWYHQEAPDREGETSSDTGFRIGQSGARAEERWQNLGQRMQVDLETVSS
ncbi:MAG: hypothetical protein HFJ80_05710, partial [Clostridiales bacterium]|nr:hypothetical protein [Clostridiales bacterium]